MQLKDKHVDDFISLYEKHFGMVLDRETAEGKGMELCNFIRIVSNQTGSTSDHYHQK